MSKEVQNSNRGNLIVTPLEEIMPSSMLPYAEYVILDRALPRVEDGLKPVQRRILYTMYDMGLLPDKPHKKSARIVGDCMGKYHPHGDSSVYDAMVRMAQEFNMRLTLVDGHGNFGSVDGDSAAAMRYTEARLQPLALELLKDIEKDTVRFGLNFDDSLKEPETLPGRFPNLLVNGASGIAVGLATNIPTHNLGEVIDGTIAYIDNPNITLMEMMMHIKAPDFSTGGYIIANELFQAYSTGKGKITMRAKVELEQGDNEKINIVITELPYQVNKATLLQKIASLREDKKDALAGIYEVCDESDRKGMRAVIRLKKDSDADKILEMLFKYTDLECTFGINMVAIADGKPRQMGIIEIIKYYVEYQREIVLRRTKFDLAEAKHRSHILQGLIIAVSNIDEVIAIIKGADNVTSARKKLIERFEISEEQAQAILDLRLARLTKLEIKNLQAEVKELKMLIEKLSKIVESKKEQMEVVKKELLEIKEKYPTERKTILVSSASEIQMDRFDSIKPATNCVICYTADNSIKFVSDKNYTLSATKVVENTPLKDVLVYSTKSKTDRIAFIFTNYGNVQKISLEDVELVRFKDKGERFNKFCTMASNGEKPVAILETSAEKMPDGNILLFTKDGYIKKTSWSEYDIRKGFFQAIKLKEGDEVVSVENEIVDENETIFFVTKNGMCLNCQTDDIPEYGRISAGVRGINLNDGDEVVSCRQINGSEVITLGTKGGLLKRVLATQVESMARYRKGVKIADLGNDIISFVEFSNSDYTIAILGEEGFVFIDTSKLPVDNRNTKFKTNKNIKTKVNNIYSLKYLSNDVEDYLKN